MTVNGDLRRAAVVNLLLASLLAALLTAVAAPPGVAAEVAAPSLDFEAGLEGWEVTGDAEVVDSGGEDGGAYLQLAPQASVTATLTGIDQGTYSLSWYERGSAGDNNGKVVVSGTGGPESVVLTDGVLPASSESWGATAHRNVLVYNGQATITITAGSTALAIDSLALVLDAADDSVTNFGFEDGLDGWTATTGASLSDDADTGDASIVLADGNEISQVVAVEPSTRYALTMRVKVEEQDTFTTVPHFSWRGRDGETVVRDSRGDRVNVGVRLTDGTVLRQAPAGTEDYSLVSVTFVTDADTTAVEVYANTVYDEAYLDSITVETASGEELADDWVGNGDHDAHVDNVDLFALEDDLAIHGADVSFLQAIEDNGGTYYANGVQQDGLRILANRGVNSVTSMIFVDAGSTLYHYSTLQPLYQTWTGEDGQPYLKRMIQGGYWDEEHTQELAVRAAELGMSYEPSFHFSDAWISAAKAYTPAVWTNVDYEGNRTNSDLEHLSAVVYSYVYDFMSDLMALDVDIAGVKTGNEQNGGLVWPVGQGATSTGHAAIITAAYQAVQDVDPTLTTSIHTNNGYDTSASAAFFNGLEANGAEFDGESYSLYGGRSSGNIIEMALALQEDENRRYREYIDVEAGFSFTRYAPTFDQQTTQLGQSAFYRNSANGQYNWLLDYMQASLDVPNPYAQERGFYYWEASWIPTPGAGSSDGGTADVNNRILFNNGTTSIQEMGSSQPGKAGDAMDSLYAYLMRGVAKEKSSEVVTPLSNDNGYEDGVYGVALADPTGISLASTDLTVEAGSKLRLEPVVTPTDVVLTSSVVTYASADEAVASVTDLGYVVGVAPGTTTVTVTDAAGHTASTQVTVPDVVEASELTLTVDDAVVADGGAVAAEVKTSLDLTADLGDASGQRVVYTTSDPEVASFFGETEQMADGTMRQRTDVDEAVQLDITAAGTATITATSADGSASVSFTVDATKVAVEAVSLDVAEATLDTGRTLQLTATVAPADASFFKVSWESSDEALATVSDTGLVTAVAEGDVTIRAVAEDDSTVYGEATLHIVPVRATGVVLSRETMTLQLGTATTLQALVLPEDAAVTDVTWASSDPAVVAVDANGVVAGQGLGTATVTVTTVDGGFTASVLVTVQEDAVPVTGLALDVDEYWFASDVFSSYADVDGTVSVTLHPTVSPADATDDDVVWSSDDPSVATVNAFGIVTAVSPGVARITAETIDGAHSVTVPVYVPLESESFDALAIGDTWGTGMAANYIGTMSASVQTDVDDQVLLARGTGTGGRAVQKTFATSAQNGLVVVDFDWNVGAVEGSKGAYVTLTDSEQHRYLSIQTNWKTELVASSGGTSSSSSSSTNEPLSDTVQIGEGFDVNSTWYRVHAELDFVAEESTLTVTSIEDPSLTSTVVIPFADMDYTGDVATMQLWTTRSGTMLWETMIDDVNIYEAAPSPRSIDVDTTSVRLIPVEGTLGASAQVTASVSPSDAVQDLVWISSDTDVVTVTEDGLIEAAHQVASLADVVPGTATVRVSSVSDPDVYVEIPVTVTDTVRASEFFWIEDETGATVFEEGAGASVLAIDAGDPHRLIARLTGGDGDSDVAGLAWESSDPSAVRIDPDTGEFSGVSEGAATLTLVATMYSGDPKVGSVTVEVTGNANVLESLEVTSGPDSSEVVAGADLDLSGLVVTGTLTDGSTQVVDVAELEVSGFDAWTLGEQTITLALVSDPSVSTSLTVTVVDQSLPTANLLTNGGFEDGWNGWDITWTKPQGSVKIGTKATDAYEGTQFISAWSSGSVDFTVAQTVQIMPGWYVLSAAFQGNATNVETITMALTDADGTVVALDDSTQTTGQHDWELPQTSAVYLDGGTVTASVRVAQAANNWTVVDDVRLVRVTPPDTSSLVSTIDAAASLTEAAYSAESWTILAEALADGAAVLDDTAADQDAIDQATASIEAAIAALVEVGYVPLEDYRIATRVGETPALPETLELLTLSGDPKAEAVSWEEVTADDFSQAYAVVDVTGTVGAVDVVLHVEVVPAGLIRFVDASAGMEETEEGVATFTSPAYAAIAAAAGLVEGSSDGLFDGGGDAPWGLVNSLESLTAVDLVVDDGAYDKALTAWISESGSIEYRFWLPAGSYELTAGFASDEATTLVPTVTHEGVATTGDLVEVAQDASEATSTITFRTYRDSVITLTVDGVDGDPSLLSWIGIVDTTEPAVPGSATAAPAAGVLSGDNGWDTGLEDGSYAVTWNNWWGQNATSVAFYEDGVLIGAVDLSDETPGSQSASVDVTGRADGTYTYVVVARNALGATTSAEHVVKVTDASPGQGVLSHDNWDKDGDFTVTFDLWWGTNGTEYRLYEDGELIDTQVLDAGTPGAQSATTMVTGREPGKHTYVAELINAVGVTATKEMTVTVR